MANLTNELFYQRSSPVDGSITWSGEWASDVDIDAAAVISRAAFTSWSHSTLKYRCEIANAYATFLDDNREAIARTITLESGKPLWESEQEIHSAIAKVANAIDAMQRRRWTTREGSTHSSTAIRYKAMGRIIVLGPYNLPLHLPGAHIVPALLAGNTILFKPSEKTPAVGDWIAKAWQAVGLPPGVLLCLHGAVHQAKKMVSLLDNAGVLFTGSYAAGVQLHQQLAGRPECLLALEMGGNNPLILDRAADRKAVVVNVILSAYITSGQRCTCARRLIIIDHPENRGFLEELSQSITKIKTGVPLSEPQPFLGTLVSESAADSILRTQEVYGRLGGVLLNESKRLEPSSMLTPGLIFADRDASKSIMAADEEHFGPFLVAYSAKDLEEAVSMANQTKYGLAAGVLSDDRQVFEYVVDHVNAGIVNWNSTTTGASGKLPFGGVGASGNHRPSGYFAADYCSYPIASIEEEHAKIPPKLPHGLEDL